MSLDKLQDLKGLRYQNEQLVKENSELRDHNDELYGKVLQLKAWIQMLQSELEQARAERDSHGQGY